MWPVKGPDFRSSFEAFLRDYLDFCQEEIEEFGEMRVENFFAPRPKITTEAVVYFRTPAIRDTVRAEGPKLAVHGSSTGMRIHVPGHLASTFKLLEQRG